MEEEKKKITPEQKKFYAQLCGFIAIGFLAPIIYLITRYNLFRTQNTLTIGLWGVIVFAILVGLISVLVWYYLEGMRTKFSIWKQIITGFVKIIGPLLIFQMLLMVIKDNVDLCIETIWVFIACESVAIIVNPLPKWCFDNGIKGLGEIAKEIYKKKHEDDPQPNRSKKEKQ